MSDPIDPSTGRGKKADGWKTVVMPSPFANSTPSQQAVPPPPTSAPPPYPGQPQAPNYGAGASGFPPPPAPYPGAAVPPPPPYVAGQGYPTAASQNYPPPPAAYPGPYPGGTAPGMPQAPYGQPVKKSKTWVWVLLGVLSLLLLGFVGCVAVLYKIGKSHMAVTPDAAVTLLHERMKDKDASTIYSASDPAYKQRLTHSQSDAEFERVASLLGAPLSYKMMETRPVEAGGQDVVNTYALTTFEKGSANETMEWRRISGEYKLVAYGIQSDNLR